MDYIGYTMNICLILFMISVTGSHCQYYSNRDIILTPHQLKTYPGKILYYRPHEFTTGPGVLDNVVPAQQGTAVGTAVPWEEVLKETVFLALNDNKTSAKSVDGSTTTKQPMYIMQQQRAIYGAPYIGAVDLSVPRFGDIVELAHGRLEKENDEAYFFIQDDANIRPTGRNVSAFWKVERIRHRDELRGHRYELKFTVAPVKDFMLDENAIVNRSFVIRDEDYPRYFGLSAPNMMMPMMKKNDQFIERTVFDPMFPYHPAFGSTRYIRPTQPSMTLGEFLFQTLWSDESTPKHHHHPYVSNGYRLGNRVKFPESFTTSQSVPKYYHHIHMQRPSIAPLAPTAPPMPPLFKETHSPAPSNIQRDYTRLVDFRGATDNYEARPSTENSIVSQTQRQSTPLLPAQPTHIHHHHHQQQLQQQQSLLQSQNQPFYPQQNNPPPLQPLPQNLVQSIPIFTPQNQLMLNHIPISPNHMIQVSQAPIAIPIHLQLLPPQGQIYPQQQDTLHAVPIRIMQQGPVHLYPPPNPYLAPQHHHHHPAHETPSRYVNQSHQFPQHFPNSIPTTSKGSITSQAARYTPRPSTSPQTSPTASKPRYVALPTAQASPAGLREKFIAPAFQPATSAGDPHRHKQEQPVTTGNPPIESASPKFQSFGIENAVTPKSTTDLPVSTAADNSFTPSIGYSSSIQSNFFSNFIDEQSSPSDGGKLYAETDPFYHRTPGTTPISFTTASPPASTAVPNFTAKFTSHPASYKGVPSATIVPPQIETPISSTLKSFHYFNHHENFDFVPSRVVELAHVKKVPKKQGPKRKNPANNHHHVTVTSHKPLKFGEGPDSATHRPESQLTVQLPPPEKDFNTYYTNPKQYHKAHKPKNFVTQSYTSTTTPIPTSLTTPASTTATTSASTGGGFTNSDSTEKTSQYHSYVNHNSKSDYVVTTLRPRLVIKNAHNSPAATFTEKPILKWIPKRFRNKTSTSPADQAPTSSVSLSSASVEQASSSSSERTALDASKSQTPVTQPPQGTSRPSLENKLNRLRASRGRSRYTQRRVTTPGTPSASQHSMKLHRMRTNGSSSGSGSTSTTTSTIRPVPGITASAFDSNRLDHLSTTEADDHQPEESIVAPFNIKNESNEKSKRDTTTEEGEVLLAQPMTSKQSDSLDSDYQMIKATVTPVETNNSNMVLFEASDAFTPTFHEITMSIINHARAIANQTERDRDFQDITLQTNEIDHKEELPETTISMSASIVVDSTNEPPITESTVFSGGADEEQTKVTVAGKNDHEENGSETKPTDDGDSSRSETTVSVDN
ncbi:mucin-2-like [Toxorhynchites rutilus septentrionalis]|uniref:mucin-2-like n=1 Tax=Toxorhynchites rutilus septentrionalis TaxID=329112 RepID=UPI002478B87C|nr:mucin-2-like [Toxorhynchites rutilus septentrionalis]